MIWWVRNLGKSWQSDSSALSHWGHSVVLCWWKDWSGGPRLFYYLAWCLGGGCWKVSLARMVDQSIDMWLLQDVSFKVVELLHGSSGLLQKGFQESRNEDHQSPKAWALEMVALFLRYSISQSNQRLPRVEGREGGPHHSMGAVMTILRYSIIYHL